MIKSIISDAAPSNAIQRLLSELVLKGPEDPKTLEKLAYFKLHHAEYFRLYEQDILSTIGLFYKIDNPDSFLSIVLNTFSLQYESDFGKQLTPVQASIRYALNDCDVVSISAPTSAGKSYAIRSYLQDQISDSIIVVPSRSLVDEYLNIFKEMFKGDKNVLVSPFVDDVFRSRSLRHIFVVTPERAKEIFAVKTTLDIGCFFFDEAHLSEDMFRGVTFSVLVEKIKDKYPKAKLIFAHPFVENPEAQIEKFGLLQGRDVYSKAYKYGAVGRICVYQHKTNRKFYYFSPYEEKGHRLKNAQEFPGNFKDFVFQSNKTVLVYVSKSSIYKGEHLNDYLDYIDSFEELKDDRALALIDKVEQVIGANKNEYISELVAFMKYGVVVHHGSVPLEVRFLIEEFIHLGFSRICFATTTLAQGVNMPFDIVWLDTMHIMGNDEGDRALAFKNLIGRSGRLSQQEKFDYGYVFTNSPKIFSTRIKANYSISDKSIFDKDISDFDVEQREDITAIKDGTFDEETFTPLSRIARITSPELIPNYIEVLEYLYAEGKTAKDNLLVSFAKGREILNRCFLRIYETYINRVLLPGELAVFEQAIWILSFILSGLSFKEISKRRYSYLANMTGRKKGDAKFMQAASHLPNLNLKSPFSILPQGTKAQAVHYDAVVYDTYDYVDHVISFSINDKLINAFKAYLKITGDISAKKVIELLRYGTNDGVETLLLRYGFSAEDVPEIVPMIQFIDEENILFKDISNAPEKVKKSIEWYLP